MTCRDNYEADLQIREQTKGVDKQDPKHALLAHPCMKSNRASMTRLGLSDSEASERGQIHISPIWAYSQSPRVEKV